MNNLEIAQQVWGDNAVWHESALLHLYEFAGKIRKDEREKVLGNLVEMFRAKAESSDEHRNFWQMAANMIESEFGDGDE